MIHKYKLFGYNMVIDTESGSVHELSDAAYDIIDHMELILKKGEPLPEECPVFIRYELAKYESGEVGAAYTELCELYKQGALFSLPQVASGLDEYDMTVKALCLYVSNACNMQCGYCFAADGFDTSNKFMSEEVGKKAVDFLFQNSKKRENIEIDFFGGEPLMNFDTVKSITQYAKSEEKQYNKNTRLTLTTNGTLLDDATIAFINENMSNIVLSLDGERKTNDNMRCYTNGGGVYDDIIPKYKKLVESRGQGDYYVRGTFTRHNLNFAKDVLHLADLGFKNISIEPVVASENCEYSIRAEDLPVIFKEYEILAKEIIKRNRSGKGIFNFFHFNIDMDSGPCVYKRIKGCGSGSEYVAVTPEGDIYPCHQFIAGGNYKLGNVDSSLDHSIMKNFASNNITSNKICADCFVKYFCGGGCAANNYNFNGDINNPYRIACEMEKKRVECALIVKALSPNN